MTAQQTPERLFQNPASSTASARRIRYNAELKRAGIPKLYWGAKLGPEPGPEETGGGCFITGPVGVGKTYLAVAILIDWMLRGVAANITGGRWNSAKGREVPVYSVSAAFVSVPDLFRELQASFGNKDGRGVMPRYLTSIGLVLDDLGTEGDTDWRRETLYGLISRRINDCYPTIITSNLSLKQIEAWEPRVASRLTGLEVIKLRGPDRRVQAARAGSEDANEKV